MPKERIAKLSDFGFGLFAGEPRKREEYPDSSYKAPTNFTPEQADLFKLGKTLLDCLECLPQTVPQRISTAIQYLVSDLVAEPPKLTAAEAVRQLRQIEETQVTGIALREELAAAIPELGSVGENTTLIRDAIHGDILLSARARALIDHVAFQRLRYLRAFPVADVVYPSLSVSYFEYALGDYAELRTALTIILRDRRMREAITSKQVSSALLVSLLRWLYQFPYERQLVRSTQLRARIKEVRLTQIESDIPLKMIVEAAWGLNMQSVTALVESVADDTGSDVGIWLLSHPLGSSSLAWMRRVAARCRISVPDFERLYQNITLTPDGTTVVLRDSALPIIEDAIRMQALLFERVLYHQTVLAAEAMLQRAFAEMVHQGIDLFVFRELSDSEFLTQCAAVARERGVPAAAFLIDEYRNRHLFKVLLTVDISRERRLGDYNDNWGFRKELQMAADIAKLLGVREEDLIVRLPDEVLMPLNLQMLVGTSTIPLEMLSPIISATTDHSRRLAERITVYAAPKAIHSLKISDELRLSQLVHERLFGDDA